MSFPTSGQVARAMGQYTGGDVNKMIVVMVKVIVVGGLLNTGTANFKLRTFLMSMYSYGCSSS